MYIICSVWVLTVKHELNLLRSHCGVENQKCDININKTNNTQCSGLSSQPVSEGGIAHLHSSSLSLSRKVVAMMGRRQNAQSLCKSRVGIAIAIGVLLGCIFALCFPNGFISISNPAPILNRRFAKSIAQVALSSSSSSSY